MKKFAKFWKAANFRLKFGLIVTLIFFIIGFVVYYVPHVNPFTFNTYPNKLGASAEHWLGTTSMGQDVVWLLIEAIHNSLVIGLIVAFLGTVVGVFVKRKSIRYRKAAAIMEHPHRCCVFEPVKARV